MATATDPPAQLLEADSNDSGVDDSFSDTSSYSTSLASAVKNYKYENGRRYHGYREGEYVLPNDEAEQDRQDLLHHVRNLTLGGKLFLAPIKNPQRVIDVGTGTGIWAIDFADDMPEAEVLGTDLSPIQPSWVPPNLHFQIENAEFPWVYSKPFDYIHTRDLGGSISDWPKLMRQAYEHLAPGGWLELQEFEVTLKSDDDTLKLAPTFCEYIEHLHKASEMFKKPMNIAETHKQTMIDAGFEDVTDDIYKVPSSPWPKDPRMKEIGRYNLCSLLMAVEAYSLALFTRVLGWSNEATQVHLAGVRKDLKNRQVHSYCNLHVVYGRKPLSPGLASTT
ncbi:S-adenosyl-L-methionine-dependent methyltransferase [Mytilinidion resinicola]|uniref:S-adenosyl-L-methionine-dependent methyltransferase n=1 Tax=Mytilinidion resinicola TaxID=574789 RepID=A0A6A6ZAJ8_9PEZI|nr:S-adenosyl-L-methionine-dependent methyltransferase [Mytilinidion resinicola]KAF2817315.1 S-adenosyl-L-methionine-dependent methyltransferase [Mytilinidion resinicola]